jgi:GNAT superfamily N-acetyltransferase
MLAGMLPRLSARGAVAADYPHFARLFPELGVDDPIPPPDRWTSIYVPETVIFEDGGAVVAYAHAQALRGVGYVRQVVVDPARRGQGLGRAVMQEVAARLTAAGCSRWRLNVKPDNEPAVRLYRSVGLAPAYTGVALRFGWDMLARLPRGDRAVVARPVGPDDDAPIEAAFGLVGGLIASIRARGTSVLLRLVDAAATDGAPLGFASYDPQFPGAFPFRVGHPTLAAPLLDAIRPHELPGAPHMQVVVEDDEPLALVLIEAGATVRLRMLHMMGDLSGG